MNKIAFMTAVAFAAIPAMADDASSANCCDSKGNCCPKEKACCTADKDAQCGDQCWLNVETITLEAANGDPLAQYTIAWLTDTGKAGVEQDSDKAADMYAKSVPGLEKAAADGNAGACLALARMYAEGKGVEKNADTAGKYMEMFKACKAKDKAAKDAPAPAPAAADAA